MLIRRDPFAGLTLAAGCTCRFAAVHALGDPARELEAAAARIFVDEDSVGETLRAERGIDFGARAAEPGRQQAQGAASGWRPSAESSAASAASHTSSSFALASMT